MCVGAPPFIVLQELPAIFVPAESDRKSYLAFSGVIVCGFLGIIV